MGIRRLWAALAAAVCMSAAWVAAPTAGSADTLAAPATSAVAVSGSSVTATVTVDPVAVPLLHAEFFLDSVGADGSGTPMALTATGHPAAFSVAGTLPALAVGSQHTVYVHGEDNFEVWGPTASAAFTVGAVTVPVTWGNVNVVQLPGGVVTARLAPTDPCQPTDPCRVLGSPLAYPALPGVTRTTVPLSVGTLYVDTVNITLHVAQPGDPCTPTDPCRVRLGVVSLDSASDARYRVTTSGFTVAFTPPHPI